MKIPGTKARLSAIRDPYGNHLDFQYDPSGRLIKSTIGIFSDGSDFNLENVTQGITPGKIVASGLPMLSFEGLPALVFIRIVLCLFCLFPVRLYK